jgi:hypothetical protein
MIMMVSIQEEKRAKAAGTHVIASRKFDRWASRGRARDLQNVIARDLSRDADWNFLYAITHLPATFARLPSYHPTITISLPQASGLIVDAGHCSLR